MRASFHLGHFTELIVKDEHSAFYYLKEPHHVLLDRRGELITTPRFQVYR
jgi:hypothetical protein